jgi:predicted membrane metal-binding protein
MKPQERPQVLLAIAAICISLSSFLPIFFKTLFVHATGRMEVFSPWVAALLLFAYVYRQLWVRKLALFFCGFAAIMLIIFIGFEAFRDSKTIALSFLLLLQIVTILILKDKEVKIFLSSHSLSQL